MPESQNENMANASDVQELNEQGTEQLSQPWKEWLAQEKEQLDEEDRAAYGGSIKRAMTPPGIGG